MCLSPTPLQIGALLRLESATLCNESSVGLTAALLGKDTEGVYVNWTDSPKPKQVRALYMDEFTTKPSMPAMAALCFDGMESLARAFLLRQVNLASTLRQIIGPARLAER